MARGRKTGGRDFAPGDPRAGRPKGARDQVPRSFKASHRRIYEEVLTENEAEVKEAAAHYLDAKPVHHVEVKDPLPPFLILLRKQLGTYDPMAEPERRPPRSRPSAALEPAR